MHMSLCGATPVNTVCTDDMRHHASECQMLGITGPRYALNIPIISFFSNNRVNSRAICMHYHTLVTQ